MFFRPQTKFMLRQALMPTQQLLTQMQARAFVKSMEERKEDSEKKSFQDDIKYFLSKDTFTVHDFQERVMHGLKQKSTFKLMVWGEDAEVKVLEGQNKICSAMYDDEKNNPKKLLSNEKKREIAETTSMQVSDVQDVLQKYYQLENFHLYLKGKKQRQEPMPESREELMQMYRVERPAFLTPK